MTSAKLTSRQSLFVGVTLFSMFSAGNLIIPPLLGLQAGGAVVPAMIGFLITGIGLPMLGIIAVGLADDSRPRLACAPGVLERVRRRHLSRDRTVLGHSAHLVDLF